MKCKYTQGVEPSATISNYINVSIKLTPDSKVRGGNMGPIWGRQDPGGPHVGPMNFHGANMGPIWDRQDPGGPHVGPMNFAIWDISDIV